MVKPEDRNRQDGARMITRRNFVKLAAAGSLAVACRPLSASGFYANKLNLGVGAYSYHSLSIEGMIVQLKKLDVGEIEMSRDEFMLMSHPDEELFHSTHSKLNAAGIRCTSYYSATIENDQDIDNAVRFARILDCRNITGDATRDILKRIDERLTKEGLTFGLHNHFFPYKFAYESPEDVLGALEGLSETMGATADTGHFASCGYDPAIAIRKLARRLRMVHLKDVKAKGGEVNVLLGSGVAKIPEVVEELHRQNFHGFVAVEYEKEGDVNEDMAQEIEYARKLAKS